VDDVRAAGFAGVFTIFDKKLSALEVLFGLGYRRGLFCLSSKVDICEAIGAMWRRDCIRTQGLLI